MRVNDDYMECNAKQQISESDSVFSFWRRVLQLRHLYVDVFVYGRFEMVDIGHPSVFCYIRIGASATATIITNFKDNSERWVVPKELWPMLGKAKTILTNSGTLCEIQDHIMFLKPFEAFVLLEDASALRIPKPRSERL